MSHANALLTRAGRLLLAERTAAGMTWTELDRQTRLTTRSVATGRHRTSDEDRARLQDRSGGPYRFSTRPCPAVKVRICPLLPLDQSRPDVRGHWRPGVTSGNLAGA